MNNAFPIVAKAVNDRLNENSKTEMFTVACTDIFASYLNAFPAGSNPIFRERTEHDCSCCKQFIRNFGRTVAIVDGKRVSVWSDYASFPEPYATVAKAMDDLLQQGEIEGVFRTKETRFGQESTIEILDGLMGKGMTHRWNHFHGMVASRFRCDAPATKIGEKNATAQVFRRGLAELKPSALTDVLDLIDAGSLYRGAEFRAAVANFKTIQDRYFAAVSSVTANAGADNFVWANLDSPAARIRNTAVGTLLTDLSEEMPLENAVRKFEAMVAPSNYRRPTALVTPKMVDAALAKLDELGLLPALDRRFAKIGDISVNDILFVDNGTIGAMAVATPKDDLRKKLLTGVKAASRTVTKEGNPIFHITDFLANVVPTATKLEVLVENRHLGQFVSLSAPANEDAAGGKLFKWGNDFAWSYDGEVTDSLGIKAKVKAAGGNTDAKLRVSLAWHNSDDLDLHCKGPDGHIYFGSKMGILDVDTNGGGPSNHIDPVENLSWVDPRNGLYSIAVNQYSKRNNSKVGFTIEIECAGDGVTQRYSYPREVFGTIQVATFAYTDGRISNLTVPSVMVSGEITTREPVSQAKWGINTLAFVPVTVLMNSPNHWDSANGDGAKHWFFMLDGCKNPDPIRGIYNEYLRNDLTEHRKTFEMVGAKTKAQPTDDQISGLGFTLARDQSVTVRVNGGRSYTVTF